MLPYRILDHTADVGVEASGRDLDELFAAAAAGMYAVMTRPEAVRQLERRRVELAAEDVQDLLVAWLLELLFITETEGLVFSGFAARVGHSRLVGEAAGEQFDAERHATGAVVKAVTRHQLSIEESDEGYRARFILDI